MRDSQSALIAAATFGFLVALSDCSTSAEEPTQPQSGWRERSRQNVHGSRCTAVAFSLNGRLLASAGDSAGGNVRLWEVATGAEVAAWEGHKGRVSALAFSADDKLLATGGGVWNGPGEVAIRDVANRKQVATISIADAGVLSLAFSPDGKVLAIGSGYYQDKRYVGAVTFYSVAESRSLGQPLQGHFGETPSLSFSPDGKWLVTSTGSYDEQMQRSVWELKLWDVANGRERAVVYSSAAELADSSVYRMWPVVFSRDGKKIAFGGRGPEGGVVRLYDVATGGSVLLPGHKGMVWALSFSADSKTLAVGDGEAGVVRIWNVDSARQRGTLASFKGAIFSLAHSPNGKSLAAAGTEISGETGSGVLQWWVADR